jgi:hypothetical protein
MDIDAGYSIALERQLELLQRVSQWESQHYDVYKFLRPRVTPDLSEEHSRYAREALRYTNRGLSRGDTFFWSESVCEVVERVAQDIPDWILVEEGLPTREGCFWFAHPLPLPPDSGYHSISALSWTAVRCSGENTSDSEYDWIVPEEEDEGVSRSSPFFTFFGTMREDSAVVAPFPLERDFDKVSPFDYIVWPVNVSWRQLLSRLKSTAGGHEPELRYIAAAFAFLQQKILISEPRAIERATRRRIAGLIERETEPVVSVIKLRRVERGEGKPEDQGGAVDWSCQWIVRGHWRSQWHPSLVRHQAKWIAPYIKGPEDKPLKPTRATVYAVVR